MRQTGCYAINVTSAQNFPFIFRRRNLKWSDSLSRLLSSGKGIPTSFPKAPVYQAELSGIGISSGSINGGCIVTGAIISCAFVCKMGGCAAINCSNLLRKGHILVKFPKNKERRKIWVNNCRRDNWKPGPGAQLCLDHFEESQFESLCKDRKNLRKTAVPSLFSIPNPPPSLTDKRLREIRCPKPNTQLALVDHVRRHAVGKKMSSVHKFFHYVIPYCFI